MSGTFPSSPGFRSTSPRNVNFNYSSESQSGRLQARNRGGQRWGFTVSFPPMTRAEFGPVAGFIAAQDGALETFQIVLPQLSDSTGTVSGSMLTNGALSAGATSGAVDGFTGILKAGDFFKFASHTKVYMATADRDGAGTLSFRPALVEAVADNNAITYDSVPFTVRLANDVQEWGVDVAVLASYEIDMIEAI